MNKNIKKEWKKKGKYKNSRGTKGTIFSYSLLQQCLNFLYKKCKITTL